MSNTYSKEALADTMTNGGCISDDMSLREQEVKSLYPNNPMNSDQLSFLGWIKRLHIT